MFYLTEAVSIWKPLLNYVHFLRYPVLNYEVNTCFWSLSLPIDFYSALASIMSLKSCCILLCLNIKWAFVVLTEFSEIA
jgi:hypothetical protein